MKELEKPQTTMRNSPTRQQIKKMRAEMDKLWSYLILHDQKGNRKTCQWCGKRPAQHAHHIISRRYNNTRWDLENGIALCQGCHYKIHNYVEEGLQFIFGELGEDKYWELFRKVKDDNFAIQAYEYEKLLEELRQKKNAIEAVNAP